MMLVAICSLAAAVAPVLQDADRLGSSETRVTFVAPQVALADLINYWSEALQIDIVLLTETLTTSHL